MKPEETFAQPPESRLLKQAFTGLVDAMRYEQQMERSQIKIQETENDRQKRLSYLDRLQDDVSNLIQASSEVIGKDYALELSRQITSFSFVAIEQAKKKISESLEADLKEQRIAEESARTKTFKDIEVFLAASPFPILDKMITLKYLNGAYAAKCSYRCVENLQYDFSLDCKGSVLLSKEFRFSTFEKEMKIPVSLGKSWMKKEPVPDYERLDQYFLSSAELTGNNLIADFSHPEKPTSVSIIYSRQESHTFLTVHYSDPEKRVTVTSEPSLNRFLDSETLEKAMGRLSLSIAELESHKIGLTGLVSDDQNVLEKMECLPFFAKSWRIISPRVAEEIKRAPRNTKVSPRVKDQELLDETYTREKLASLGESGKTMLQSLIIDYGN